MPNRIGRPPKNDTDKKGAHLSIRMSAKLRELLEAARHHPGGKRSLSQEIELRLWESFTPESTIEKRFGGPATANLLGRIAHRIRAIEVNAGGEHHWLDDRFTYDQVRIMIGIVLDHFKPRSRRAMPKLWRRLHPSLRRNFENMGRRHALQELAMLAVATKEPMPNEMPPVEIYRAALPLGRRIRGSPIKEFEKILREEQALIGSLQQRHNAKQSIKPKGRPK